MSMNNNNNTSSIPVYIGMDAHTTNYNVSFLNSSTGENNYECRLEADDYELIKYIKRIEKRHFSDGNYEFILGYEAGYTGYQTARNLKEHGIKCVIMAPNTIKRSPKEKRYKNDVADARLLAQTLFNNDYSEVEVPTPEEEALSHLLKHRDKVVRNGTRIKNEITSLLTQKGFKSKAGKWSRQYFKDLAEFIDQDPLDDDIFVLEGLLDELTQQQLRLEKIDKKIEEDIEKKKDYEQKVDELIALKGVSTTIAINMISVAKDVSRFETADQFVNYLGLAPGDNSSGLKNQKLGITKNGNPRIRALLIQGAQTYSRGWANYKPKRFLQGLEGLDPKLQTYAIKAYERLHKKFRHLRDDLHKPYNVCVCAVARELACFVWGILSGNID